MNYFSLSRVMRPSDYGELVKELETIDRIQAMVNPPHPHQHTHRRWEYALAFRAYSKLWQQKHQESEGELIRLKVADWGSGIGLLPGVMVSLGEHVDLVEPWVYGDEAAFVHRQMEQITSGSKAIGGAPGTYTLTNHPCLCELGSEHWGRYDVSFCISTLEHIGEEEKAFRQLCKTVKPGGMIFLTMDFADNAGPHQLDFMRSRMYTSEAMEQLVSWGFDEKMTLPLPGDWKWSEECRMVNDYGFSSLWMIKET